jgi:hypothetical protein
VADHEVVKGDQRLLLQNENGCFNSISTHWGLDHVFKHDPTAIVNFVLTLYGCVGEPSQLS